MASSIVSTIPGSTVIHSNLNLCKKSILDARLEPVATISSLPDPNSSSKFIPEGGTILVRDTNKNYQAQVDPLNLGSLIWVDISVPATGAISGVAFIELSYSSINSLYTSNTLQKGAFYKIIDRADYGIVVQATNTNELSMSGVGVFLVPDYQNIGNYTNTPLAVGDNLGVWWVGLETSINTSDILIYNGIMYQCISNVSMTGSPPNVNTLAYMPLPKNVTNGYIMEVDSLIYSFSKDTILERRDKRGNILNEFWASFQWGNDAVFRNIVSSSAIFDIINSKGQIYNNELGGSCAVSCDNTHEGLLHNNRFNNRGFSYTCNMVAGLHMNHCTIELDEAILFNSTEDHNFLICTNYNSSFTSELNMSVNLVSGVLTIPTNLNYVGSFILKNNSGQTINKIFNLPSFNSVRFEVKNGETQNFNHTAVGSISSGDLVSDSAALNNIIGRSICSDIIEYQLTGVSVGTPVSRRTNIVKLS